MRPRRAVAAASLAVALLWPAVAHGQQEARPAVGGGSFNDAPLLDPGRYSDSLRFGERVYYAFAVKPGQRLHVRARVPGDGEHVPGEWFSATVLSPMRELSPLDIADVSGNTTYVYYTNEQIDYRTAAVQTLAAADAGQYGYNGPGAWFVSLSMPSTDEKPIPVEVPVELEVAVEGQPVPEPRPTATPTARAPAVREVPDDRGGQWVAGLLIAGLAGLLVGLALAAVARVRSRPRSV